MPDLRPVLPGQQPVAQALEDGPVAARVVSEGESPSAARGGMAATSCFQAELRP